jgi:hypothetical protein
MLCTMDSIDWIHLCQAIRRAEEVSTSSECAPKLRYNYIADLGIYFAVVYN